MYADLLSGTKTGSGKSSETDLDDWYVITLNNWYVYARMYPPKYARSKVRKSLPQRILVYHSGVVARKLNGSQQTGVY